MNFSNMILPVLHIIAENKLSSMALFTAYIDDELGYEWFCYNLPADLFNVLKGDLEERQDLREMLNSTGILRQCVKIYLDTAFDDCNMLYHLMDGLSAILSDPVLSDMVPADDRRILEGMFQRWLEGKIGEENWEAALTALCKERASK